MTLTLRFGSAYNDRTPTGLQAYLNLIAQRAKMEGCVAVLPIHSVHCAPAGLRAHQRGMDGVCADSSSSTMFPGSPKQKVWFFSYSDAEACPFHSV